MNTGIGDAVNLGWKLAQVAQGREDESLLDTYEPVRIGFARVLISTTDRAFTPIIAEGLRSELTPEFSPACLHLFTRFSTATPHSGLSPRRASTMTRVL